MVDKSLANYFFYGVCTAPNMLSVDGAPIMGPHFGAQPCIPAAFCSFHLGREANVDGTPLP